MLHRLGEQRLQVASDSAIVTRRADGTLVVALWNYAPPVGDGAVYKVGEPAGSDRHFSIDIAELPATAHATMWRLDQTHGNVVAAFDRMGRPDFPSRDQLVQLRQIRSRHSTTGPGGD
jgi:xylan 1,4-beta-xylosidase